MKKTLTIITVAEDGEVVIKHTGESPHWERVDHLIFEDIGGIYGKTALRNHLAKQVSTDYILWACPNTMLDNLSIDRAGSELDLTETLAYPPERVASFFVPTLVQQLTDWRDMPAADYDMILRLRDKDVDVHVYEVVAPNTPWYEDAERVRLAYLHRESLPTEW